MDECKPCDKCLMCNENAVGYEEYFCEDCIDYAMDLVCGNSLTSEDCKCTI